MSDLVHAIRTDLELLPVHRRLLSVAHEWDTRGRHRSDLLRRNQLREAEGWLARTGARPNAFPPTHGFRSTR